RGLCRRGRLGRRSRGRRRHGRGAGGGGGAGGGWGRGAWFWFLVRRGSGDRGGSRSPGGKVVGGGEESAPGAEPRRACGCGSAPVLRTGAKRYAFRRPGFDEGPGLGGAAFFLGVLHDIGNGAVDVGVGVEEDVPTAGGPRRGQRAIGVGPVAHGVESVFAER